MNSPKSTKIKYLNSKPTSISVHWLKVNGLLYSLNCKFRQPHSLPLTLKPYFAIIFAATEPPKERPYFSPDTGEVDGRGLSLAGVGSWSEGGGAMATPPTLAAGFSSSSSSSESLRPGKPDLRRSSLPSNLQYTAAL